MSQPDYLASILESVNRLHARMESIEELKSTVGKIDSVLHQHIIDETNLCVSAFPNGDMEGHRRSHEARIKEAEERAEFWSTMRKEAGKLTVYAFLFCCLAVTIYYWNGHMLPPAQINIPGVNVK